MAALRLFSDGDLALCAHLARDTTAFLDCTVITTHYPDMTFLAIVLQP